MLDHIIPVLTPASKPRLVAAEPEMTKDLPELESNISFLPLINYLKEKQSGASDIKSSFYNYLIKKFEAEPLLLERVHDEHLLEEHSDLLELLGTMLFPVVSKHERQTYALAKPYEFEVFYYSDCFKELFLDAKEENLLLPAGLSSEQLKKIDAAMVYDHVLERFYDVKLNEYPELIYPVTDAKTGLNKYYRIRYDRRFIDVRAKGNLPELKDCAVCMNTFRILDLEKQLDTMPLDLFEMEGFAVWVAEDVTETEAVETIKKIFLRQNEYDSNITAELKSAVQVLVGLNNVEVGMMSFVKINEQFVLEEEFTKHSLIGKHWKANDPASVIAFKSYIDFLHQRPGPIEISLLNEQMVQFAPHMKPLYESGVRSYLYYPLQNSEGLLGFLEVASPIPNLLTHDILLRLEPAIPLLSAALLKNRDNFYNNIEKLIKENFTALQQSVEWKFAEVAWNHFHTNDKDLSTANVSFEDVYPLYGAIDIRNSSLERSSAIQKDLKTHLDLVDKTLDQLDAGISLPILEGLKFKIQGILSSIAGGMLTDDEVRINEFIENEVHPVFTHLQKTHKTAESIVNNYLKTVNDKDSVLYHYRTEYEDALETINDAVLRYLEKEEEGIQKSYPHYFERYRTDGVEYNIYIGQSIAPNRPFDLLYLKNIRLWQLKSMAKAAMITHRLLPTLKVPLQTTQLILVHSQCISISFRNDERRFDVEGAYNIRYATIKKRLDKARIKETNERLTQPEKIAIVYSNQKDLQEYQEYVQFLQNKGILKGIELLELEDLQGVKGLRAMRVEINLEG